MINKKYFTLIEAMIVSAVLGVALLTAMLFTTNQQSFAKIGKEKKFGYEKAMQILNELKTFQETKNSDGDLVYLDDLSDGSSTNPILSAQLDITDPTNPISDNVLIGNNPAKSTDWKYSRRIHVIKSTEDSNSKDVRKVGVQIFLTSKNKADAIMLAEVWTIIQTAADPGFPPTQVYDLYAIALESVPGWWVFMNNLIPQVENAIKDLESRNSGLDFRVHWITKMGYGRNPFYTPIFNIVKDSAQTPYNSPYFYPSVMPSGSSTSEYYVPRLVKAYHKDENDKIYNGYDATTNPAPYTVADTYNQANTYPLMLELYNKRLANNPDEEMPYTLLLDDMHLHPQKYKNALFINLHGELLPVPATRNYADAAKHPQVNNLVTGDLNRIAVEATHSVIRETIDSSSNTVSVTQLNNLADDADLEVGDYIRLDNEVCRITAINKDTKTLTISRGEYGTVSATHQVLCPVTHQAILLANIHTGDTIIPVTSSKGLVNGEKLSIISSNMVTLGTIIDVSPNQIRLSSGISSGWSANSLLICSSAIPTLRKNINTSQTNLYYHTGGVASPLILNDLLNIGGEILKKKSSSTTRALYDSPATEHKVGEVVGLINFSESVRVVTHPENARYNIDQNPKFRVYAWQSDSAPDQTKPDRLSLIPITILIKLKEISLGDTKANDWITLREHIIESLNNIGITRIEGGVAPASSRFDLNVHSLNYPTSPTNDALTADDDQMYARIDPVFIKTSSQGITPVKGYFSIAIRLYNTPLRTPYKNSRGLKNSAKLYGLEYLPTPFKGNFDQNLTSTGIERKNTARWIFTFPSLKTVLSYLPDNIVSDEINNLFAPLKVETRIGDINLKKTDYDGIDVNELVTGTRYGEFVRSENFKDPQNWIYRTENFSQTHTWIHNLYKAGKFISLADDKNMVFSDKYQLMGDPRYQPCADVFKAKHYNCFFTNTDITSSEGIKPYYKGWGPDHIEHDIPRMMQMIREAIMNSNSIFTTINGYSFYYIGIGNEIGYDSANGFKYSIPVNGKPYNKSGKGWAQHITNGGAGNPRMGGYGLNYIRHKTGWICAPSIGELYKDADSSIWQSGSALPYYYRVGKADDSAVPAAKKFYSGRRCRTTGCKSFYNAKNPNGKTFDHDFWTSNATILPTTHNSQDIKDDFETMFNIVMPTTIQSNRPWRINDGGRGGAEWYISSYVSQRTNTNILQVFYEHDAGYATSGGKPVRGIASGLMQCYDPNDKSRLGYFAIHGIAQTATIGSVFIGRYAIMSLLYSHLRASSTDNPLCPTKPIPLIEITTPTDMSALKKPGIISVQWNLQWKRWDGETYTKIGTYDKSTTPGADGFFKVGYSDDNRKTWKYLNTDTVYTEGKAKDIGLEIPADITAPARLPSQGYFLSSEPDAPAPKTRWNYTMTWNLNGFPKGTYYLRVEYHRKDPVTGIYNDTHYSHHIMTINIED